MDLLLMTLLVFGTNVSKEACDDVDRSGKNKFDLFNAE